MAIISKVKKDSNIAKKVNFKESIYKELLCYADYLGFDITNAKNENEAISYTVNEALKYVFNKDKDFKEYKESIANKKQQTDTLPTSDLNNTDSVFNDTSDATE